jgi:hypothetical protein
VKAEEGHVDKLVQDREPDLALKILDGIEGAASGEEGARAKKRADEISADPKMKTELEASKAYDRLTRKRSGRSRRTSRSRRSRSSRRSTRAPAAAQRAKYLLLGMRGKA